MWVRHRSPAGRWVMLAGTGGAISYFTIRDDWAAPDLAHDLSCPLDAPPVYGLQRSGRCSPAGSSA